MIGAERIRYENISGNTLINCTRGVAGTAATTHANGSVIVSAGPTTAIPVSPDPESWPAFDSLDGITQSNATMAGVATIHGKSVTEGTI